jgi:hypothetical protein
MDRRQFLRGFGALIGGIALEQAIPFGRVWSFPSVIQPRAMPSYWAELPAVIEPHMLRLLDSRFVLRKVIQTPRQLYRGRCVTIRLPHRYQFHLLQD